MVLYRPKWKSPILSMNSLCCASGGSIALAALIAAVIYLGSRSSDALPILFVVAGLVTVIGVMVWLCTGWFPDDQKIRILPL